MLSKWTILLTMHAMLHVMGLHQEKDILDRNYLLPKQYFRIMKESIFTLSNVENYEARSVEKV